MRRYQDIRLLFALLVLLTAFVALAPAAQLSAIGLDRLPVFEIEKQRQRCEVVDIHEPGQYWLVMHSDRPSTAPSLMVLGAAGSDPRTARRVEAMLLHVVEPGEHIVCRTSESELQRGEWGLEWAGDPLEIEELIDPFRIPDDLDKAGDPLEIEEVIDP